MSSTRRDFLKASLMGTGLLSLSPRVPGFLARSVAGAAERDRRDSILVVVQLSGGNDGLNALVPYGDDEYHRNRPTLALPVKDLHKIDSYAGFHPRMKGFARLFKDGHLSVIRAVGYPNSDRSHERAMRIWHTAAPEQPDRQTGWLGRTLDSTWDARDTDAPAVFVGPIAQPFALNAEGVIVPSVTSLEDVTIRQGGQPSKHASSQDDLLCFVRCCTSRALATSQRIEAAAGASTDTAEYPSLRLAEHLHIAAQLIRADVGIRIFFVEIGGGGIGGFDNHANQLGNHCALLGQLSQSVAAFVDDLKRDNTLNRVLLMTFSEFGRTLKENGRRGTGHGAAAPIFLAGGRLKGGLIGSPPSLTDLDNGALKFKIDFRRVYATVLDQWLGFDSRVVLGERFESLGILHV